MSEGDPRGFRLGISRAVLTYPPVLHCWSLVDLSKSRIKKSQIYKHLHLFSLSNSLSHIQLYQEEGEVESITVGCCLPAKHAQTQNPITFLITGASWLFRALCFIWDFTFPSLPLDMAHPAASNQVAEGSSGAG